MKPHQGLLVAVGIALGTASGPAVSQELPARLQACAAIGDRDHRLVCYDQLADELRVPGRPASVPSPGPTTAPVKPAPPVAQPEENFGMEGKAAQAVVSASVPSIVARVSALREFPGGRLVVELDNGQLWERVKSGPSLLLKAGDQVTIERAAMGSFRLVTEASRAARVRRIQ